MDYLHYYYEYSLDTDSDSDMSDYLEYLLELMEIDSCVCKVFVELLSENPNSDLMYEIIEMVEFHLVEGYRIYVYIDCLLYTSPSPRDRTRSRMPSSA